MRSIATEGRLRAAVIGVGSARAQQGTSGGFRIGYTHAAAFMRSRDVDLVAASDISRENLDAFERAFPLPGAPGGYLEYREMLAAVRPDVISIGTYVGLHRQIIEDAALAGVHGIMCEKPFVASPAELAAVRTVAERTGVKIVVSHIRRYRPAFVEAAALYSGGAVGDPVLVSAAIPGWDLAEWGTHWLDMFRFLHADRPVRWVFGQARVRDRRGFGHAMEDHSVAHLAFEGGGRGLLECGEAMSDQAQMTLLGSSGTIRIYGEQSLRIETSAGHRLADFRAAAGSSGDAMWDRYLADLVGWIAGGPEPHVGLTGAAQTTELLLGAYLSAVRGDRVDLPLDTAEDEWPVELLARRAAAGRPA